MLGGEQEVGEQTFLLIAHHSAVPSLIFIEFSDPLFHTTSHLYAPYTYLLRFEPSWLNPAYYSVSYSSSILFCHPYTSSLVK